MSAWPVVQLWPEGVRFGCWVCSIFKNKLLLLKQWGDSLERFGFLAACETWEDLETLRPQGLRGLEGGGGCCLWFGGDSPRPSTPVLIPVILVVPRCLVRVRTKQGTGSPLPQRAHRDHRVCSSPTSPRHPTDGPPSPCTPELGAGRLRYLLSLPAFTWERGIRAGLPAPCLVAFASYCRVSSHLSLWTQAPRFPSAH